MNTLMKEFESEKRKVKKNNLKELKGCEEEMNEVSKSANELSEASQFGRMGKESEVKLKQVRFPKDMW